MAIKQRSRGDVTPHPWVPVLLMMLAGNAAFAASTAEVCKGTWANCGIAVKTDLQQKPQDPRAVVELGNLWAIAYDKQYEWLRAKGGLQQSTPDADKIFEVINSKLNPIDIATDKLKTRRWKRW